MTFGLSPAAVEADEGDGGGRAGKASKVTVPDLEDVEHLCALLTACDKLPLPKGQVPSDLAGCVRAMYTQLASPSAVAFSLTLRECGLRSSSCGALRSCALRGARTDVCAGRGAAGYVEMCDADGRAVTCLHDNVTQVRDCPRGGEQCVVREGKAICALGSCAADAPVSCSPSGTRVLECKKGKLESLDCAAFGLRCEATKDGPRCVTDGAACGENATRCEGGSAVSCFRGHEVRVDCAAAGMSCASGRGPEVVSACAMPAPDGGACDPAGAAKCDGAVLRYCAWGKPRGYLCKSMGFAKCVSDDKGARCAN